MLRFQGLRISGLPVVCFGPDEGRHTSHVGRVQGSIHFVQHKERGRLEAVHGEQQRQGCQRLQQAAVSCV